jgi:cell division septation protein DedD
MKAKHKVLADQQPVVVKADLGTKGVFYRLRLAGYSDSESASAACSKLKAKGIRCYVSKINS